MRAGICLLALVSCCCLAGCGALLQKSSGQFAVGTDKAIAVANPADADEAQRIRTDLMRIGHQAVSRAASTPGRTRRRLPPAAAAPAMPQFEEFACAGMNVPRNPNLDALKVANDYLGKLAGATPDSFRDLANPSYYEAPKFDPDDASGSEKRAHASKTCSDQVSLVVDAFRSAPPPATSPLAPAPGANNYFLEGAQIPGIGDLLKDVREVARSLLKFQNTAEQQQNLRRFLIDPTPEGKANAFETLMVKLFGACAAYRWDDWQPSDPMPSDEKVCAAIDDSSPLSDRNLTVVFNQGVLASLIPSYLLYLDATKGGSTYGSNVQQMVSNLAAFDKIRGTEAPTKSETGLKVVRAYLHLKRLALGKLTSQEYAQNNSEALKVFYDDMTLLQQQVQKASDDSKKTGL